MKDICGRAELKLAIPGLRLDEKPDKLPTMLRTVEQIRRVFGDKGQFCLFLHKTYVEAILMSTHNICFYGELMKIILQLSSNTHHILFHCNGPDEMVKTQYRYGPGPVK